VGTVVDVTERKRADEERERLRQAQADLARIARVTTMGELTASLAHEIRQPIAAAVTDANTCLRWLTRNHPDLEEAREAGRKGGSASHRQAQNPAQPESEMTSEENAFTHSPTEAH